MIGFRLTVVAAVLSVLGAGCSCDPKTQRRFPTLQLLDAQGGERTLLDFGQVQVGTTGTQKLRLHNAGSAALNVSATSFSKPLFALVEPLPLVVDTGGDLEVTLSFKPTEPDQRITGDVTFSSDDPDRPAVKLGLAGTGVSAVAVLSPTTLDFGEVYLTETKKLTLGLTNAGSNELIVTDARFSSAVPGGVTADLASMKRTLTAGQVVQLEVTFAPTQQVDLAGALELVLGGDLGTLSVTLKGRGVQALPRMCFKYDDTAFERCTDQTVTSLTIDLGKYCDRGLFPLDAGAGCVLTDGGVAGYGRSAKVYFKNEGNTQVAYSLQYDAQRGAGCDAGTTLDFLFSNARPGPDGGALPSWSEATAKLPLNPTDPKPWETAPVSLSYQPRSRCTADGSDSARVVWTRQGEPLGSGRAPSTLLMLLTGGSMLPKGEPHSIDFNGSPPLSQDTLGVNSGEAPLTIVSAQLWQGAVTTLADGGTARGTTPGELCTPSSTDACAVFSWAAGMDPAGVLPVTLPGTTDPTAPATKVIGRLTFGAASGAQPAVSKPYTVFVVLQTTDTYNPPVVSRVTGVRP